MKNYKNKYFAALLLCSVTLFGSCKKYINETPIDAPTTSNFWTSESAAKTGLAGAYGLLRTALTSHNRFFTYGDVPANEFTTYNGDYAYVDQTPNGLFDFNYVPYGEDWQDWTTFYQVIAQCNLIISKVPSIPASTFTDDPAATKKQVIAEAYFLRAFCYYYVTMVWGQPVIVTQSYTDPIHAAPIARSTDAQGYAQVVTDLKQCIPALQYGYTNTTDVAVQANRGAAYALLAKTYMWQKQYDLASSAADSVIDRGGYTLEPGATYGNIWKGHDPESIFEINMLFSGTQNESQSADGSTSNGVRGIFGIFLQEPFVANVQSAWYVNTDLVNNLFTNTKDIRLKADFYGLNSSTPLLVKYANVVYQNPGDQTNPFVSNNMVIFRLADILLLKAEAQNYLGNAVAAKTYLNMVRARAGLKAYTGSDLLNNIMDERGREFYGEGSWYFDLFRTGLIGDPNYDNTVDGFTAPRINGGGCHWPIYMRTLLQQDPLLVQNPWWAAHS